MLKPFAITAYNEGLLRRIRAYGEYGVDLTNKSEAGGIVTLRHCGFVEEVTDNRWVITERGRDILRLISG